MDFSISKDELLAAIDKCSIAVPDPKHTTPGYRVMLVEAKVGKKNPAVRFAAVGEFCSVDTLAAAEIKAAGMFHVMPKHLRSIVAAMPTGRIQFTMKGTRITAKSLVSSRKASFENLTVDTSPVEDPGKKAAWQTVSAKELLRALNMASRPATWIDRNDPEVILLIPTERGVDVFACNGYIIVLAETSLRLEGGNIQMPKMACDAVAGMLESDDKLRIFTDEHRVYLENCDTLFSARLPAQYYFQSTHPMFIGILKDPKNDRGPSFDLPLLAQGTKAVLASTTAFAGSDDRGARGYQLHITFGGSVLVEATMSEAEAKDEFDIKQDGASIDFYLSSQLLDSLLSSLTGVGEAQALRAENMLVLRSEGVLAGIMEERRPQ